MPGRRDPLLVVLRTIALLIALRSLGNLGKPFGTGTGLMFFGFMLKGPAMWVLAPAVGLYMIAWAYGLWNLRSFAVPMGVAYLGYVVVNLIGFPLTEGLPKGAEPWMYAIYALVGFGVPALALWILVTRRRARDASSVEQAA